MKEKHPVLEKLGANIREVRTRRGISQEQLALGADLDRTYVGGVERGERNIAVLNLAKIARALYVKVSDLTTGIDRL